MNAILPLVELCQYTVLAYITGYVVLGFIPKAYKPRVTGSKTVMVFLLFILPFVSFIPLIHLLFLFKGNGQLWTVLGTILTEFPNGQAWLMLFFICLACSFLIWHGRAKKVQLLLLGFLFFASGFSGHAASFGEAFGLWANVLHVGAVSVWSGVLFHIAWFSNYHNWQAFLKWFTPLATGCLVVIFTSGVMMMFQILEPTPYTQEFWTIPYGRLLVLKHLTIIPILIVALMNGFLHKKAKPNTLRLWLRIESLLLLLVLGLTAMLSVASPTM